MKAKLVEIFKSIQGEGLYQGQEQVFVRFYGCNLKCSFCDTKSLFYTKEDLFCIMEKINDLGDFHSVSLTGGEPLLQIEFLKQLAKILKENKRKVYLETNGVLYQNLREIIDFIDIISMDFKLPTSTNVKILWEEHSKFLKIALKKEVFVKAVIGLNTSEQDLIECIHIIKKIKSDLFFVLQPQNPYEKQLKSKMEIFEKICQRHKINVKIMFQLHKKLGIR